MRDDRENEIHTSVRDEPPAGHWQDLPGGSLEPRPAGRITIVDRTRPALVGTCALLLAAAAAWTWSIRTTPPASGSTALWNVELSSAGVLPVTALVFGEEAGIHLVRLPAAGTPSDQQRHLPVRLGQGNVYMVSLGRNPLGISTQSPPGATPTAFWAEGRFVKLFQNGEVTGVRTGWW